MILSVPEVIDMLVNGILFPFNRKWTVNCADSLSRVGSIVTFVPLFEMILKFSLESSYSIPIYPGIGVISGTL